MSTLNALGPNPYDIITVAPANPAAGANFSQAVNLNARWRIVSFSFRFVTDANAATRFLKIHGDDGTDEFSLTMPSVGHTATVTTDYQFNIGTGRAFSPDSNANNIASLNAQLELKVGETLQITIVNIQVGDQISDIVIRTQQWIQEE